MYKEDSDEIFIKLKYNKAYILMLLEKSNYKPTLCVF